MCSDKQSDLLLNEYLSVFIQLNGIQYVCDNFIDIREDYYNNKIDTSRPKETDESRDQ